MLSFLAPGFLKRLDQRLLLNSPILWISKLHYVAYYTFILWVLTALIAIIIPINLSEFVSNGIYYTFFTIISIVLFCVWLFRNTIFNIESNYGNRKVTDEYKVFFVNFLCVFLLFSFAYPYTYIYNARIANSLSEEELISEINALNIGEPFFVRSYYDYNEVQIKKDSTDTTTYENSYQEYNYKYNIKEYRSWNKYTPFKLINDSTIVSGLLSSDAQEQAFNRIRRNDSQALQAIQNYVSILKRHGIRFDYEPSYVLSRYKSLCAEPIEYNYNGFNAFEFNTDFGDIEAILRNISDAKYDGLFIFKWEFNLVMFYFVFYLVLLFMMFKTVRWQQYLITAVSFILLPILLFIFSMLLGAGSGSTSGTIFMTALLLIYLAAVVISMTFFIKPIKFNAFKSVCMQIVYVCTPVFFVYFVFYLDENTNVFWRTFYYDGYTQAAEVIGDNLSGTTQIGSNAVNYNQLLYEQEYKYHRELFQTVMWSAVAFGFIFHISFFMVFMKEQFLKMKSLPKNK